MKKIDFSFEALQKASPNREVILSQPLLDAGIRAWSFNDFSDETSELLRFRGNYLIIQESDRFNTFLIPGFPDSLSAFENSSYATVSWTPLVSLKSFLEDHLDKKKQLLL